jgi:hypothetical protein
MEKQINVKMWGLETNKSKRGSVFFPEEIFMRKKRRDVISWQ